MRRFENGLDGSEVVPLQVRLEEGDRHGLGDSIEEVLERVNLTTCTLQTLTDTLSPKSGLLVRNDDVSSAEHWKEQASERTSCAISQRFCPAGRRRKMNS